MAGLSKIKNWGVTNNLPGSLTMKGNNSNKNTSTGSKKQVSMGVKAGGKVNTSKKNTTPSSTMKFPTTPSSFIALKPYTSKGGGNDSRQAK